jgi:hypothetical protein
MLVYLHEGLALLLDCINAELRASIAHYPGVGRIKLISEQRPEGGKGGANKNNL